MEKEYFDIEDFKPRKWLMIILLILLLVICVILANKVITDKKENDKNKTSIFDSLKESMDDIIDDAELEKNSFNRKYELYAGTKYGVNVSDCLDEVILNNKKSSDHLITVVYADKETTDATEIKDLKKNWDTFTDLEVSVDYGEDGYVNKITIEKVDEEDEDEAEQTSNTTSTSTSSNTKTTSSSSSSNFDAEYEATKKQIEENQKQIEEKTAEFQKEYEENEAKINEAKKIVLGE